MPRTPTSSSATISSAQPSPRPPYSVGKRSPKQPAASSGLEELAGVGYFSGVHVQDELARHVIADESPHFVAQSLLAFG